jgi:hypothetical protein
VSVAEIPAEDARKAAAFKRAIAWVAREYGRNATVEAFGDPEPINAAWEREDLENFRAFLWERCKVARRGAA